MRNKNCTVRSIELYNTFEGEIIILQACNTDNDVSLLWEFNNHPIKNLVMVYL